MMLWWKYQQLRSSNVKTRLAIIAELAAAKDKDSIGPLLFALKDQNKEIRSAAALALGQFRDKQVVEALVKLLEDQAPLARATAAEALAQLEDQSAVPGLLNLLRDSDAMVRMRASRSLERLGWQPENESERTWHTVAKGNLSHVADLGSEGVQALADLMRSGGPDQQLAAVKSLAEIEDPGITELMLEALKLDHLLVQITALDYLGGLADPAHYNVVEAKLTDRHPNIRSVAISAAVKCGGKRAVPKLLGMLRDVSWEVRREVIKALGKIGDETTLEGLSKALQDSDHDVRETAAFALGKMRNPRAILPLVLALLDPESFVRDAASTSLEELDPNWQTTEAARSALPQVKAALKHREYWISYSAGRLLEKLTDEGQSSRPSVQPPVGSPSLTPAHPGMFAGNRTKSPSQTSAPGHTGGRMKLPEMVFDILTKLLADQDRDLRLAAIEAFGRSGDKRASAFLGKAIQDEDDFVRQSAERALLAIN